MSGEALAGASPPGHGASAEGSLVATPATSRAPDAPAAGLGLVLDVAARHRAAVVAIYALLVVSAGVLFTTLGWGLSPT